MATAHIEYETLLEQICLVLRAWKMPESYVQACARCIGMADLLGVDSHGISMLPTYERKWQAGGLNMQAQPECVQQTAVLSVWDGHAGLGHVVTEQAMRQAIDMAGQQGVGLAVIRNSHHFGAAGVYARMALEHDMLALVLSSARKPILVPTAAAAPVLGTNPIAFAAPAQNGDSFVLDMATTTVAANKLRVYAYEGKSLPPGWVVDDRGQSVSDTAQAVDWVFEQVMGGLTPLGGSLTQGSHKGYGLAMLVQILSATLSGAGFGAQQTEQGKPDDVGHFLLVVDPAFLRPAGAFEADLSALLAFMRALTPVDAAVPVQVAGDPEVRKQTLRRNAGVPLSAALLHELQQLAQRNAVDFLLS